MGMLKKVSWPSNFETKVLTLKLDVPTSQYTAAATRVARIFGGPHQ